GGESFGSRIIWTAAESATHYVAVAGWGDTGSYTLTVTAIRDAPDTRDDHGDSADEATFLTVGDAITGALGHGRDVDYFAFTAERGQTYRIDVDLGTLDDSVAALYDSDSRQLELNDDGGESFGSRITWTATESGTHYVAVAGWGGDTGSYTLTVTAIRDAPDTRDDHGDSADEATFASVGETVTGVLGHGGDVDYFAFAAERGQTYRIDVDLGTLDDSLAALYDSGSRQLEFDDDGGESFGSRIIWTAAESATHYVAVAGWGDTGSYTLTVTATESEKALDEPAPSDEGDEAGSGRPDSPADQRYEYDGSAVVLSWDASSGADSYTVYYHAFFDSNCRLSSGSPSFCEELATNLSSTSYTHADPDPDEHYYWVVACNSVGCSEIDSATPAALGGTPPGAPANQRYEYGGAAIVLSWDASAGADSYTVYHDDFSDSSCRLSFGSPSFCEELATDLTVTTFTHSDPDRDENYYWVVACNRFGCSTIDSANPARVAP
ncbi:MAG: PPC domain-containing protein, partial [Chloroflexi bacterium]|nr:PPC domain-containing protein [Chloroflexota bacterium]